MREKWANKHPETQLDARTERRIARTHSISLSRVLAGLGYRVEGLEVEQQFSCNLHGTGQDHKPSARYYPDSVRWYCFACGVSRDAVQTYRERFGISLEEALDRIERDFHLPPLPWEEAPPPATLSVPEREEDPLLGLERLLDVLGRTRSRPIQQLLILWEGVDRARVDRAFRERLLPRIPEIRQKLLGP